MRKTLVLACALVLLLAACGGSDSTTDTTIGSSSDDSGSPDTEASETTVAPDEADSDNGDSSGGLPSGGTGTVTVDGETIESDWVGNCIIDEQFDPHPDDLDLTASLGGGLNALFLEISNQSLAMGADPFEYVQLRASMQLRDDSDQIASYDDVVFIGTPDGTWYEDADGAAVFTLARGEQPENAPLAVAPMVLSGSNVTGEVTFGDGTVVSFDLDFVEAVDCSL